MALTITQEPGSFTLMSAYNPIPFVVLANQPTTADPCPVVYADVYFDGGYYGTISCTFYNAIVGPYAEYRFDIQDKVQEYLSSSFGISHPLTNNGRIEKHWAQCYVKFRETDVNASGFTVSVGTAPVAGTYYTSAVDGDGEQSATFVVLNTHLKNQDSVDLLTHLRKYTPGAMMSIDVGWNLSHRPNVTNYGHKIGSGKYWVCPDDHDFLAWHTSENMTTSGTAFINVSIKYLNGTTASATKLLSTLTNPFPGVAYASFFLNAGIPNMKLLFPASTWTNIEYYTVIVGDIFLDYCCQTYYVKNSPGCCKDRTRIFFKNLLGGYDGVNFKLKQEISKAESVTYSRFRPFISPSKKDRGTGRMQPSQVDVCEVYTEDYLEEDMPWLKEMIGSSEAVIQVVPDSSQLETESIYPIQILDAEMISKKEGDKFVYTFSIQYSMSNPTVNLRS